MLSLGGCWEIQCTCGCKHLNFFRIIDGHFEGDTSDVVAETIKCECGQVIEIDYELKATATVVFAGPALIDVEARFDPNIPI